MSLPELAAACRRQREPLTRDRPRDRDGRLTRREERDREGGLAGRGLLVASCWSRTVEPSGRQPGERPAGCSGRADGKQTDRARPRPAGAGAAPQRPAARPCSQSAFESHTRQTCCWSSPRTLTGLQCRAKLHKSLTSTRIIARALAVSFTVHFACVLPLGGILDFCASVKDLSLCCVTNLWIPRQCSEVNGFRELKPKVCVCSISRQPGYMAVIQCSSL